VINRLDRICPSASFCPQQGTLQNMVTTILLHPPNLHIAFGGKASDTADGDPIRESDSWSLVTHLKPLFILVAEVVETLGNLYSRISPRGATLRKD